MGASTSKASPEALSFVKGTVASNKVVVFSKVDGAAIPGCASCGRGKGSTAKGYPSPQTTHAPCR
eukprot:356861-Chlamydomonas_euryale.AAC.16